MKNCPLSYVYCQLEAGRCQLTDFYIQVKGFLMISVNFIVIANTRKLDTYASMNIDWIL